MVDFAKDLLDRFMPGVDPHVTAANRNAERIVLKSASGLRDGVLVGNTRPARSILGDAMFSDSSTDLVKVLAADTTDLQFPTGDFSIVCWFYQGTAGVTGAMAAKYDLAAGEGGWSLLVRSTNKLSFAVSYNGTSLGDIWDVGTLTPDTWYMASVTREGNTVRVGLNANEFTVGTLTADINASDADLTFTQHTIENGTQQRLRGGVDAISFYSRALSLSDLRAHYNNGVGQLYTEPVFEHVGTSDIDVESHQSVAIDSTETIGYTIHTDTIYKRDITNAWATLVTNASPFTGLSPVDHLGGCFLFNGKLYIGGADWENGTESGSDNKLLIYNADTLVYESNYDLDGARGATSESSAVTYQPGSPNVLFNVGYRNPAAIHKFNLDDGTFIGDLTLSGDMPDRVQGMHYYVNRGILLVVGTRGFIWSVNPTTGVSTLLKNRITMPHTSWADYEGCYVVGDRLYLIHDPVSDDPTDDERVQMYDIHWPDGSVVLSGSGAQNDELSFQRRYRYAH